MLRDASPATLWVVSDKENAIALEQVLPRAVLKPWGSTDLAPWSEASRGDEAVGELWFERADAPENALLLKLLFTTQPLSIQVHPDDALARSLGLAHGKTEAWYVLSATPDARVAIGLKWPLTKSQFQKAIEDGSIADLVQWRRVQKDDVILVPAGTIHAIGSGLVIAEIQQKIDATFRIFDYGRKRELQVDNAVAAAERGPATCQPVASKITDSRSLLVCDPHFVLERLDLAPRTTWRFDAGHETWLFVMRGSAQIGSLAVGRAGVVFADGERTQIDAGDNGLTALAAYPGAEVDLRLLRRLELATGQSLGSETIQ
jgi:mannose-6-phosphate isomerase